MSESKSKSVIFIICVIILLICFSFDVFNIIQSYKNNIKPYIPVEETSSETIEVDENSLIIKYYIGYNVASGDAISDTIPVNLITITGDDYDEIIGYINNLEEDVSTCDPNLKTDCLDAIWDEYNILLPNDKILNFGKNGCSYKDEDTKYKTPDDLYNKINKISNEYNEKNVFKKINSKSIIIKDSNNNEYNITNKEQLDLLSNYNYYYINDKDSNYKDEKIAYTLILDDGSSIEVYYASVLSRINFNNNTHKYIYTGELEDELNKIVGK